MTATALALLSLAVAVALVAGFVMGRRRSPPPAPLAMEPPMPVAPVPPPAADRISIDTLVDPVIVLEGSRAAAANPAARQLFGERLLGRDIGLTVRHPAVLDALDEVRRTGAALETEAPGLGATDSLWRLRVVPAGDNRTLVVATDMTQARLTERMRADFVANASHELRTPLATLAGFIETLQGAAAEDEPARNRFLAIMADEAQRMKRLIDDLMSLSRIELDKYIRPTVAIDLGSVVAEVAQALAVQLSSDRRPLRQAIPDGLPMVLADRDQIVQVMQNLVINAMKYGRSGTPITISAEVEHDVAATGAMVRLGVADQGDGIPPEHLPRLTERFYRVDSQRSRTMGGTGLGLAIVKHIVERHRGRLRIQSRIGEGTEVTFTLPVAPAVIEVQ